MKQKDKLFFKLQCELNEIELDTVADMFEGYIPSGRYTISKDDNNEVVVDFQKS
jgi:hypothetical protein